MRGFFNFLLAILPVVAFSNDSFDFKECSKLYTDYKTVELERYLIAHRSNVTKSNLVSYNLCYAKHLRTSNETTQAIKVLHEALGHNERFKSQIQTAQIYDELAICLRSGGEIDLKTALDYVNQSLEIKQRLNLSNENAKSYLIKGNVLYSFLIQDIDQQFNQTDSIQYYWTKAIASSSEKRIVNLATRNLATLAIELGNHNTADSLLLQLLQKVNNQESRSEIELNRVSNLIANRKFDLAEYTLDSLYQLNNINNGSITYNLASLKALLLDSLGRYKEALAWTDTANYNFHRFVDEENFKAEAKYKNAELNLKLVTKESQVLRNRLWIGALGTLTLLLTIGLFFMNNIRKLKDAQAKSDLENEILESKIKATLSRIEGEQHERKAIASFLHDQVSSLLTATDLHLSVIKKTLQTDKQEPLEKPITLIKKVSTQIRDISHKLVSPTLINYGIVEAIKGLIKDLSTGSYTIHNKLDTLPKRLPYTKEVFLLQSASELLNNAMKYGSSNECQLRFMNRGATIELTVINAVAPHSTLEDNSLGTLEMISRSEAFGGSFTRFVNDNHVISTLILEQ